METLRIAIITETLPPERLNLQPWRYLGDLAQAVQAEGHDTSVVTSDAGLKSWNGVRVERHSDRGDFQRALGLRQLLDALHADAGLCRLTASLFFSMRGGPRNVPLDGRLAGIFLRPLHSGGDLARRFLDPILIPEIRLDLHHAALYASRRLGTWTASPSYVDEFVFLWESDRQCAVSAGLPPHSCSVVRHPFDPFFLARAAASLGPRLSKRLAPVAQRVVFVGPPEESRGVSDAMDLVRFLPRDDPTQVVLLLRDPQTHGLTVTQTGAGPHTLLVVRGLLSREELRAIYQDCHVAVFPYRFVRTALPLVALEAVAAGVPVVTTRVHPIRELEGTTGLLFAKPGDPREIANVIRGVLDGHMRDEIQQKNEAWIQATPDWHAVARSFVSIFRR